MTSRDHLHAAARCWERAGFYQEAAERFTKAEAWRDAGRCFSQAERHHDAAVAYSRAGAPLLEAREHLMTGWPERAVPLYQRLRSASVATPREQVEVLLGLGELEETKRAALTSGDREALAMLAHLSSARDRPDLVTYSWSGEGLTPWNQSLRRHLLPQVAGPEKIWPSAEFREVSLVPIWEGGTGGSPSWGDRALHWADDGKFFAAAIFGQGLIRGQVGPGAVLLEHWQLDAEPLCTRFLPTSHAVVTGLVGGGVSLVLEHGSVQPVEDLRMPNDVWSITFGPENDRVAVAAAGFNNGAMLKILSWKKGRAEARLEELKEHEGDCAPIVAWSPNGLLPCLSLGPEGQPNRLSFPGQPTLEAHGDRITSLAFTEDGRFLFSAAWDKAFVLRDGGKGQILAPPERFAARVYGATIHPQVALAAIGEGERLHLLRLRPNEAAWLSRSFEQAFDKAVVSLAFSPNGRHLLLMTGALGRGHLHLFRVEFKL